MTDEQTQQPQQTQPQQTQPRGRRQQQSQNQAPEDQAKDATVKRYHCVRACRYKNRAYKVGDPLTAYNDQKVPPHFEPAS